MAKVIAIHEIIRANGVIKPGAKFASTGEELDQLKAAGAVKFDNDDAEDVEIKEPAKTEEKQTETKPAAKSGKSAAKSSDKDLV